MIATGATAVPATIFIFLHFVGNAELGLVLSTYALVYYGWIALLFYAGYLSLKGRGSRQQDRRIWDPDLEPLETNVTT